MEPSIVYVKTDEQNRIVAIDGGYTTPSDLSGWIKIDKGYGDQYNLCQTNYLPKALYTMDGIPQYKLADGKAVERGQEELDSERLPAYKTARIVQTKTDLAAYLEAHPLQWTDGNYYSITEEKQNQLTRVFAVYEINTALGKPAKLEWNDTGERCREWDKAELSMLASAINERVRQLVKYQQDMEVAIRNASTLEELEGIVVDYDMV